MGTLRSFGIYPTAFHERTFAFHLPPDLSPSAIRVNKVEHHTESVRLADFAIRRAQVAAHGWAADPELMRDLAIGKPTGQQPKHVDLLGRQRIYPGNRAPCLRGEEFRKPEFNIDCIQHRRYPYPSVPASSFDDA